MRFFIAGLMTETNTFSPIPTTTRSFEVSRPKKGSGPLSPDGVGRSLATDVCEIVRSAGDTFSQSIYAFAQPAGKTLDATFADLLDEIIADLRLALSEGPIDGVLLWLHGAMIAQSCDDCEGEILRSVRSAIGPNIPIGACLDLHCHLTDLMMQQSDVLITNKLYPHSDGHDRMIELHRIVRNVRLGSVKPVSVCRDVHMIGMYPTTEAPMSQFVQRLQEVECEPGLLSVSLVHGFPWADVVDVGTRVLVVANDDVELAARWAETLGREFYNLRHVLRLQLVEIDEAIDILNANAGLTVLADVGDNAGGGAPSDNTAILRKLLSRKVRKAALGGLFDPQSVATCFDVGIGATVELRLGGKLGRSSDLPVDVSAKVLALSDNIVQHFFVGWTQAMGRCAAVDCDGVLVVLTSFRAQTYSSELFSALGIDLKALKCIVVKSTQHFYDSFAPLAQRIVRVAVSGETMAMNFESLPYSKRGDDFFPRRDDPWSADSWQA